MPRNKYINGEPALVNRIVTITSSFIFLCALVWFILHFTEAFEIVGVIAILPVTLLLVTIGILIKITIDGGIRE